MTQQEKEFLKAKAHYTKRHNKYIKNVKDAENIVLQRDAIESAESDLQSNQLVQGKDDGLINRSVSMVSV